MPRGLRRHRIDTRASARIPLHAALRLTSQTGRPVAPLARCTEIGLGGLRVSAAKGLLPGESVRVELRLPTGRLFEIDGRVAWARQTLHPALFGSTQGSDDDADFGIAFRADDPHDLLPIARLLTARDDARRRARKLGRLHGLPLPA